MPANVSAFEAKTCTIVSFDVVSYLAVFYLLASLSSDVCLHHEIHPDNLLMERCVHTYLYQAMNITKTELFHNLRMVRQY